MSPRCHASLLAAGLLVAATLGACGGKPTGDDCKAFAEHYVAVMSKEDPDPEGTKTVADGMKPKLVADCEKSDKANIDCILKATSMQEIDKCESDDDPPK